MKKIFVMRLIFSVFVLLVLFGCATTSQVKESAAPVESPVITDIRFEDNSLTIKSNKEFIYTIYSDGDPYKAFVDIPDMVVGAFREKIVSDKAGFVEVLAKQVDGTSPAVKLEVTLQLPSPISPIYVNKTLKLSVEPEKPVVITEVKASPEAATAAAAPASDPQALSPRPDVAEKTSGTAVEKAVETPAADIPKATEITGIQIRRGQGKVFVSISGNGAVMPNIFPIDKRVVVDIQGVALKTTLPTGAVAPLRGVRAGKYSDKVRLVLDLQERTAFDVTSKGNTVEIALNAKETAGPVAVEEPKAAAKASAAPKEAPAAGQEGKEISRQITSTPEGESVEGRYTGKKISLDFQDADVTAIFRLLADVNGYNLVLDRAVSGKITIKLLNVPWDQALDIILNSFSLAKSIEGNIMWIAPLAAFDKIAKDKKAAKDTAEMTEELIQEIIRINYATAGEISGAITQGKLLSTRGSITIDARMNTLILKDTSKSIDKIKELVKIMDVAKRQVMIEAKIVSVSSNYSENLGIRWGGSYTNPNLVPAATQLTTAMYSVNTPTVTAGPDVSAPGTAMNMTIGFGNAASINMSLSALESLSKAKTLSNPKVLTMDNESATIQQGSTFFIPTVSQSGTQSQAMSATLSLNVTPKITPDGYVQLTVSATDNSLVPGTAGASAVVDTKSLNTKALVKDGETLVLGGIYVNSESESEDRVPLLGKIPGLGWLFKNKNTSGPSSKELLIFITPTIIEKLEINKS